MTALSLYPHRKESAAGRALRSLLFTPWGPSCNKARERPSTVRKFSSCRPWSSLPQALCDLAPVSSPLLHSGCPGLFLSSEPTTCPRASGPLHGHAFLGRRAPVYCSKPSSGVPSFESLPPHSVVGYPGRVQALFTLCLVYLLLSVVPPVGFELPRERKRVCPDAFCTRLGSGTDGVGPFSSAREEFCFIPTGSSLEERASTVG